MIKSEGYQHGVTLTAKQRATQIVEQIVARTQHVTCELFSDPECESDSGIALSHREYEEIVRHINLIGERLQKVIAPTLAAIEKKENEHR